jgi:hypothetical protein
LKQAVSGLAELLGGLVVAGGGDRGIQRLEAPARLEEALGRGQ